MAGTRNLALQSRPSHIGQLRTSRLLLRAPTSMHAQTVAFSGLIEERLMLVKSLGWRFPKFDHYMTSKGIRF